MVAGLYIFVFYGPALISRAYGGIWPPLCSKPSSMPCHNTNDTSFHLPNCGWALASQSQERSEMYLSVALRTVK